MNSSSGLDTMSFDDAIGEPGRAIASLFPGRAYVERGLYGPQIERMLRLFRREQLLFLRTDHLWTRQAVTLRAICEFLGTPDPKAPAEPTYVVPLDSRHVGGLPPETRAKLDALFAGDIALTSRLTGLDLADWLDPAYVDPMPAA